MALAQPTPLPFPNAAASEKVFQPQQQDLVVEFAEQFTQLQGKFVFCMNKEELVEQFAKLSYQNQWTKIYCTEEKWKPLVNPNLFHQDLASCDAAVTGCEFLIARTGSIVLSSAGQGRLPSVYAPVHVCIASASQLVYDIRDSLQGLSAQYKNRFPSLITLATGPSRTADIEKTLVVGVHGPKEVYCFVLDDQS